ncbi:MAG: transposase, partial [Desulfuromonadaceae bacterium]
MAQTLRDLDPGTYYHVIAQGNEDRAVFESQRDREVFLGYCSSATERYGAIIHCYCLMDDHYHLLLETPEGNLSQIMRHINGAYTTYCNTQCQRFGPVFRERFRAIPVEADLCAGELSRYLHLNPVRAGLVERPENYIWSSYRSYVGLGSAAEWL